MSTELVRALEDYRRYLAGPCEPECMDRHGYSLTELLEQPYDGHRHWTTWYERNRAIVVNLNVILSGDYGYPAHLVDQQSRWPDEQYEDSDT